MFFNFAYESTFNNKEIPIFMIERIIIKNYKTIKSADICFNNNTNIIVGDNGVGKSTLTEAVTLALGYGYNQLEITPYLFHTSTWREFIETKITPEICIEVFFNDSAELAEFKGKNNSRTEDVVGIRLRILFDEEYRELFNNEREVCEHIPCEYYIKERYWFSGNIVKQYKIPFTVQIIDSTSSYFNSRTNQYVSRLIQNRISDEENMKMKGGLRKMKQMFESFEDVKEINSNLNEKISAIDSELRLSVDLTSKIAWETILCPFLDDIPIAQIGLGEQCILKTLISLDEQKVKKKDTILIIEEPESHLSHTNLYKLLHLLSSRKEGQLFVTTHNSFVANKLNLSNLILLNNNEGEMINTQIKKDEAPKLYNYFFKVSNYPTLRLALCEKAILVEGPTDEMVITYHYKSAFGKHPFQDGIELIVVSGVVFKHFIELATMLEKKIVVITDNDGDTIQDVEKKYEIKDSIKLFTESDTSLYSLEPSFVENNLDCLKELSNSLRLRANKDETKETLINFMENNKTEWAFRLLNSMNDKTKIFKIPQYIEDAINWIRT